MLWQYFAHCPIYWMKDDGKRPVGWRACFWHPNHSWINSCDCGLNCTNLFILDYLVQPFGTLLYNVNSCELLDNLAQLLELSRFLRASLLFVSVQPPVKRWVSVGATVPGRPHARTEHVPLFIRSRAPGQRPRLRPACARLAPGLRPACARPAPGLRPRSHDGRICVAWR